MPLKMAGFLAIKILDEFNFNRNTSHAKFKEWADIPEILTSMDHNKPIILNLFQQPLLSPCFENIKFPLLFK